VIRSHRPKGPIVLVLAATALACQHSEPFSPGKYAPSTPFSASVPRQLTLNLNSDLYPSWTPDGSGVFYTFARPDQNDGDRCSAELPAGGGSRILTLCTHAAFSKDSADAVEMPVVSDSQLVYLASVGDAGGLTPNRRALLISPLSNLTHADTIGRLPFMSSSGQPIGYLGSLAWLNSHELIYTGFRVAYVQPAPFSKARDTLLTGVEIGRIDLSGPQPVFTTVPQTDLASSVSATPDGKTIYYTKNGENVVYRQDLTTGALQVVHDFGATGIARDVQVVGNDLIAIVGDSISYTNDPLFGFITRDFGGKLIEVDLTSGVETDLTFPGREHRRPALSPDGSHLAVEVRPLQNRMTDIWVLKQP
jgi:hypothetical protein